MVFREKEMILRKQQAFTEEEEIAPKLEVFKQDTLALKKQVHNFCMVAFAFAHFPPLLLSACILSLLFHVSFDYTLFLSPFCVLSLSLSHSLPPILSLSFLSCLSPTLFHAYEMKLCLITIALL